MPVTMPERRGQVRPNPVSRMDTSAALAVGLARLCQAHGKGAVADGMQCDPKTINRALTGETLPELHTAFNALRVDRTALDEVARLFGFELRPIDASAGVSLATVAGLSHLAGLYAEALGDGRIDHSEVLKLADAARPLARNLAALLAEADRIKGVN